MHILPMGSMGPSVRGNRCLLSPLHPGKKGQTFSTKVHTCAPPRIRVDTSPLSLDNEGGRRRKKRFSIGGRGGGKKKNFSVSRFFKGCSPFFFFFVRKDHAVKRDQSRCCSLAAEENTIFAAVTWTACARSSSLSFASSFFFLSKGLPPGVITTRCKTFRSGWLIDFFVSR